MKLLLHCCCGPCTMGVAPFLQTRGDIIEGWFYNPNIAPIPEWRRRRQAFLQAAEALSLSADMGGDEPSFAAFLLALAREGGLRCRACYRLRLRATAERAAAGYDAFSTTLLISPYQDLDALREIGNEEGARAGVAFYGEDLRPHFADSRARARELQLYLQNYCGCLFSQLERAVRRTERMISKRLSPPVQE